MPVRFVEGNMFASGCHILVNTVNCVGVTCADRDPAVMDAVLGFYLANALNGRLSMSDIAIADSLGAFYSSSCSFSRIG